MTQPLIVLACVLRTIEFGPPSDVRCQTPYVTELVSAFEKYAEAYDVPVAVEAAKCYHESHFDKHARGTHGEIGICQPKPHGAIQGHDLKLTIRQLENVDTNVRISTQYIATFVRECDTPSGWLTKYNRPANGCHRSRYSAGVLTDLHLARALGRQMWSSSVAAATTRPDLRPSPSQGLATLETSFGWAAPGGTSRTLADSPTSTDSDTDKRLPAGTRRAEPETPGRTPPTEKELAAPFQEPQSPPASPRPRTPRRSRHRT